MDSSATVHEKSISTFGRMAFPRTSFRPEPPPSPPPDPAPSAGADDAEWWPVPLEGWQLRLECWPGELGDSSPEESEDDGSEPGSPGPPAFALALGTAWSENKFDGILGPGPDCQLPGKGGTGPWEAAPRFSPSSPNEGATGEPHRAQKAASDDKE